MSSSTNIDFMQKCIINPMQKENESSFSQSPSVNIVLKRFDETCSSNCIRQNTYRLTLPHEANSCEKADILARTCYTKCIIKGPQKLYSECDAKNSP